MENFRFDEGYLRSLQCGDPEVEAHFASYFGPRVLLVALRMLRFAHLAEDAAQETLLRVLKYFRAGKQIEAPECLAPFVLSTCRHVALESLRADGRYQAIPGELEPADPRINLDVRLVTEERKQLVRGILAKLPARDRQLLGAMLEETDKQEICNRFGVGPEYLRVLLHRARKRFREVLQEGSGRRLQRGELKRSAGSSHQ